MFNSGANKGFWRYQLRDKYKRFVKMGGAVTFEIELPGVQGTSIGHGFFVGRDRTGYAKIQVTDAGGNVPIGIYEVEDDKITAVKAIISTEDLPDNMKPKGAVQSYDTIKNIINRIKKVNTTGVVKDLVDGDVVQRSDTQDFGIVSNVIHSDDGTSSFDANWIDGTSNSMKLSSDQKIKIWKEGGVEPTVSNVPASDLNSEEWLANAKANYDKNRSLMNGDSNAPTDFVPGDNLVSDIEAVYLKTVPAAPGSGKQFEVERTKAENTTVVDYHGRKMVIADINGVKVPFYLSTGRGGKTDVESGKWYPFFGIGNDGWINKSSGKYINNYYGSPELRAQAEWLDENIGNVVDDNSYPVIGAKETDAFLDRINQGLHPVINDPDNENLDTLNKANTADVIKRVRMEPSLTNIHTPFSQLGIDYQPATMDADGARLPTPGAFTGDFQRIMEGAENWQDVADRLKGLTITYFDFETTGISDYDGSGINNDPVQLGAVQVKDGKIIKRFNVYINPGSKLSDWSANNLKRDVKDENGNITGTTLVTPEWLEEQISPEEALSQFMEFIGPNALVGGQNVPFDLEVLKRMSESAGVDLDIAGTIDSKDLASLLPKYDAAKGTDGPKRVDPKTGETVASSSLGPVANYLGFEPANWHSADGDAEDSYNLVSKIIERAATEGNTDTSLLDFPLQKKKYEEKMAAFKAAISPETPITEKQKNALTKLSESDNPKVAQKAKEYLNSISTRGEAAKALEQLDSIEPDEPQVPPSSWDGIPFDPEELQDNGETAYSIYEPDPPKTLYHVAPKSAREDVLKNGLDPKDKTWNTGAGGGYEYRNEYLWEKGEDGEWYAVEYRPVGIYMFESLERAIQYAGDDGDIYEIDSELNGRDIIRDPSQAPNWEYEMEEDHAYVTRYVNPRALKIVNDSQESDKPKNITNPEEKEVDNSRLKDANNKPLNKGDIVKLPIYDDDSGADYDVDAIFTGQTMFDYVGLDYAKNYVIVEIKGNKHIPDGFYTVKATDINSTSEDGVDELNHRNFITQLSVPNPAEMTPLSKEDRDVLKSYTHGKNGEGFREYNEIASKLTPGQILEAANDPSSPYHAIVLQMLKLDNLIDRSPKMNPNTPIYRGMVIDEDTYNDVISGKITEFFGDSYSSTTTDYDVADNFSSSGKDGFGIIMAIEPNTDISAIRIPADNSITNEKEVLLPRQIKYTITGIEEVVENKNNYKSKKVVVTVKISKE